MNPASSHAHCHHCAESSSPKALDPVCGMKVDPEQPRGGKYTYRGTTYSFCNPRCKARFEAEPERYLAPDAQAAHHAPLVAAASGAAPPVGANVFYTCPMHPEVRQLGPGTCPKCGMALEPEEPSAEETAIPSWPR